MRCGMISRAPESGSECIQKQAMGGLTQENLRILASYAKARNRELYWNYLSQLPDADGYGTLALGVVRNDSLPGRVANSYAQDYARDQEGKGSGFPDAQLSERQWEMFGQTLLRQDMERRLYWMEQERSDLALNLPGKDVMLAHDRAFDRHELDPNCWTLRVVTEPCPPRWAPTTAMRRNSRYPGATSPGRLLSARPPWPAAFPSATDSHRHQYPAPRNTSRFPAPPRLPSC